MKLEPDDIRMIYRALMAMRNPAPVKVGNSLMPANSALRLSRLRDIFENPAAEVEVKDDCLRDE